MLLRKVARVERLRRFPRRAVAEAAGMSLRDVSRAAHEAAKLSPELFGRLDRALASMA